MTKTNIERLQELREKAREISVKNPTKIALELKNTFNDDLLKLKASDDYVDSTTKGRMKREEKLREKYRKELFRVLAEQQAEYKTVYDDATTLAKKIKTTSHEKPSDELSVKLFEQELQSLQTATMLGMNAGANIQELEVFIGKYGSEPYFASVIRDNFAQLSQNILSIEGSSANRLSLAKIFERVESKATSEEQAVANETLQAFGDGIPNFYLEGLPQFAAIAAVIGGSHAQYLNKPTEWIEEQAKAEKQAE